MKIVIFISALITVFFLCGAPRSGYFTARQPVFNLQCFGAAYALDIQQRGQNRMTHKTQKQDFEIRSGKQTNRIPNIPQDALDVGKKSKPEASRLPGVAWRYFNKGNYVQALKIFTTMASDPATNWEAKYGLAMCYRALKRHEKAISLLEELVNRKYKIQITRPALIALLLEQEENQKAGYYVSMLSGTEREKWQKRLSENIFRQRYVRVKKSGRAEEYMAFFGDYQDELKACGTFDITYDVASHLAQEKLTEEALSLYRILLSCPEAPERRLGILNAVKFLIAPREMLAMVESEERRPEVSPDYADKLRGLKLDVLYGLLQSASADTGETAGHILLIRPGDPVALLALSWWHYHAERYQEAYEGFSALHRADPEKIEYVTGMIYTLMNLKRFEEALAVAGDYQDDEKIASLGKDISLILLRKKLAALDPDSTAMESTAREILSLSPGEDDIRENLAWWYFNRGDHQKAYNEFSLLYSHNPHTKGYSFGLVHALIKLKRPEEALELAVKNKQYDERLSFLAFTIYRNMANAFYSDKKYHDAETYFAKALAEKRDDANTKEMLELSKYQQTQPARAKSSFEGFPGFTWGSMTHDLTGATGTGLSVLLNQGIDWIKLPGDIMVNTYAEYRYSTRTRESLYFDESGQSLGMQVKKFPFRLGVEYAWDDYREQDKIDSSKKAFFAWYYDWHKGMNGKNNLSWLDMKDFPGETYGKVTHDFDNGTGTGISGYVNQGIDWHTLPGNIVFNTYVEYRFNFRTGDNLYYNTHGPVLGMELRTKPSFKLGLENFWENNTELHTTVSKTSVYFRWYYDWDLKPKKY